MAFPDLKGQAPLRPGVATAKRHNDLPFPDLKGQAPLRPLHGTDDAVRAATLFLTSKVRLHCDNLNIVAKNSAPLPFPDLKGQAPLRLFPGVPEHGTHHRFS